MADKMAAYVELRCFPSEYTRVWAYFIGLTPLKPDYLLFIPTKQPPNLFNPKTPDFH